MRTSSTDSDLLTRRRYGRKVAQVAQKTERIAAGIHFYDSIFLT